MRRMEELREDVGKKGRFKKKLVRCHLKWAGQVEYIEGKWLTTRVDALTAEVED